jgi:cytoskeletal protein RodZ
MEGKTGSGFGNVLRQAREKAGLTVEEVAGITRIQGKYLRALEEENWDAVPPGVIGRGFVRVVGKQVDADVGLLLELYREAGSEQELKPGYALPEADWEVPLHTSARGNRILFAVVGSAAVLVLVLVWVIWLQPTSVPKPVEPALVGEPTPVDRPETAATVPDPEVREEATQAAAAPTPAAGPHRLKVQAVERTWVRVVVDGERSSDHEFAPGETRTFEGRREFWLKLGNAAGVRFTWDGEPLKVAGDPGAVITLRFPDDLERLRP